MQVLVGDEVICVFEDILTGFCQGVGKSTYSDNVWTFADGQADYLAGKRYIYFKHSDDCPCYNDPARDKLQPHNDDRRHFRYGSSLSPKNIDIKRFLNTETTWSMKYVVRM